MPVPNNEWSNGAWNNKLPQLRHLGGMVGLNSLHPSADEVQEVIKRVASAKVFQESVEGFLAVTGMSLADVRNKLIEIEGRLGLMDPIPFRSLNGLSDPTEFRGVAVWPAGTVAWTQLRWEQIKLAEQAGATFERIIVLGSSRVCSAPADVRHPAIKGTYEEGSEPTERQLMKQWVRGSGFYGPKYTFPELPDVNDAGKPLSLSQQLNHLAESSQWAELVGELPVYVPSNPNALYVPLHVCRVLGLDNVWFSQAGARLMKEMPTFWWPSMQDVMTTPSGILRLWVELIRSGCIASK